MKSPVQIIVPEISGIIERLVECWRVEDAGTLSETEQAAFEDAATDAGEHGLALFQAHFDETGVTLNVVPVVDVCGVAIKDARDLVGDRRQRLLHVRCEIFPAGFDRIRAPHDSLERLRNHGVLLEIAIARAALCESICNAHPPRPSEMDGEDTLRWVGVLPSRPGNGVNPVEIAASAVKAGL